MLKDKLRQVDWRFEFRIAFHVIGKMSFLVSYLIMIANVYPPILTKMANNVIGSLILVFAAMIGIIWISFGIIDGPRKEKQ